MLMEFEKRGARVEAEAAALAAARHPGVVDLISSDDGVLRTTLIEGARTLADEALTPDEVAGVVATVASTLADLHERGVVHGGIEAGHVLVDPAGRPVLCSLGRGGDPADDVAALGRLAGSLLAAGGRRDRSAAAVVRRGRGRAGRTPSRSGQPGEDALVPGPGPLPVPPASAGRGRLRRRRLGPMLAPPVATVLAGLAARATSVDPAARPTARELAAAIRHGVPTARWPAPVAWRVLPLAPARPAAGRRRWPWGAGRRTETRPPATTTAGAATDGALGAARTATGAPGRGGAQVAGIAAAVVAGNIALVAAVVVISNIVAGSGGDAHAPSRPLAGRAEGSAESEPAPPVDEGGATTSIPLAVRVWPPEPLDYRDGVLTLDGVRYAIGRPGDAVAAGDWACSGRRTLALLRAATGEVFAFDAWPAGSEDTAARLVATVPGASGLRAFDADGDGCDDLEVARAGDRPVVVEAAPSPAR